MQLKLERLSDWLNTTRVEVGYYLILMFATLPLSLKTNLTTCQLSPPNKPIYT